MNLFDSLTLLTLLLASAAMFVPAARRPYWLLWLPAVAAATVSIHLLAEGFRLQMVPAYAVLAIALVRAALRLRKTATASKSGRWATIRRIAGASLAVLLLLASAALSYLFPLFDLPQPSGPYAVGLTEYHMIDASRPETYTSDPSDVRELMVQAWYPAEPAANAAPSPYWRHASVQSTELANGFGMPSFLFSHIALIPTHSYWNAPVSASEPDYPVLIFSHGFAQGSATQNTSLMETLASHGYIIFSIDHAYVGAASIYPDGRVAAFAKETFAATVESPGEEAIALFEAMQASTDWREQVALLEQAIAAFESDQASRVMEDALAIWAEDQLFVLDELSRLQSADRQRYGGERFKGRLDLSQLGIFGMSFGGSTSLQNCVADERCKAGINLDGFQASQIDLAPLQTPFMFINSDNTLLFNAMFKKAVGPAYGVSIGGSMHLNHADFSIFSPLFKIMGVLGPIDGYRMLEITDAYVLAFFDKYLKGEAAPLLDAPSDEYAEVLFEKSGALLDP